MKIAEREVKGYVIDGTRIEGTGAIGAVITERMGIGNVNVTTFVDGSFTQSELAYGMLNLFEHLMKTIEHPIYRKAVAMTVAEYLVDNGLVDGVKIERREE